MANNTRDVNLRIRARDETAAGLRSAQSGLDRLKKAQDRTSARKEQFAGAVQSSKDLRVAYDEAAAAATKAGERIGNAARPSKKMRDELNSTREAARKAKVEYLAAESSVRQFTNTGFAGFDRLATSGRKFESTTRAQARAQDELAGAYRRTEAAATSAAGAQGRAAGGGNAATRGRGGGGLSGGIVDAITTRNERGPLGLRPYELTNLGYQVNDLITQIASGTSPMQAFAQQGGQIAQIFPKATGALLRFVPVIAAGSLALAPFVSKLMQTNAEARRLKDVTAIMQQSGEAATYSAPLLVEFAKRLEDIGLKADEAKAVLALFVREAVDPAYLDAFAKSAQSLSKALGVDITTAAEKVTTAFTGNSDAVLALDDQINFLTDSERKNIEALKKSGKEAEVRTRAFAIFERRYNDTSNKMQGPWTTILKNFNASWQAFVDYVNFVDFSQVKAEINGLLNLLARLSASLPGARDNTLGVLRAKAAALDEAIAAKDGRPRRDGGGGGETREQLVRQRFEVGANIATQENEARRVANNTRNRPDDTTRDPSAAPDSPRARPAGGSRGQTDAQKLAEQQAEYNRELEAENAARTFQLSLLDETERQQQILTALRAAEIGAERLKLTLLPEQRAEIERTTSALYDRTQAQAADKAIAQAQLELAKQRGEVETRVAFIARMTAAELADATDVQQAKYAVIIGQLYDIEESKRRQVALEQQVSAQEAIRAELMGQLAVAEATGDTSRMAQLRELIVLANADLLSLIETMILHWEMTGGPDADLALLKLRAERDAIQSVGKQAVVTGTQINQMLSQGGARAFDQFFQGLSEGVSVFASLRNAFGAFAADFLRQIAQMIIQLAILNALGGGKGGGGGAGGSIVGFVGKLFGSKHTGGLVGHGGGFKSVNPAVFAGALRYHSGGLVGLAPNEVPIIAERNEEVLTENDPRHRANGGGGAGNKSGGVKIVNVFDPADALDRGLATEAGERSIMNFIRRNSSAVKAVLG